MSGGEEAFGDEGVGGGEECWRAVHGVCYYPYLGGWLGLVVGVLGGEKGRLGAYHYSVCGVGFAFVDDWRIWITGSDRCSGRVQS